MRKSDFYSLFFKRFLDVLVSFFLFLPLLVLFTIVAILIKIDSKGPIFFTQERVGLNLRNFTILKFRTMTDKKREVSSTPIIGKTSEITKVGYILRRTKIDELPQIINVLKGDMSLIGPRPSIRKQLDNLSENEKRRYSIRPGLTGLAQVCGNIHLSWKERYEYDLKYLENISFFNDVKILVRTAALVFIGEEKFKDKPLKIVNK